MKIDWESTQVAPAMRRNSERRIVSSEQVTVLRVQTTAEADFEDPEHRHDHEQWIIVQAGSLEVSLDGQREWLSAGDVVHVPPRMWHSATGVGAEGATYLEISSPARFDLLPGSLAASALTFRTGACADI